MKVYLYYLTIPSKPTSKFTKAQIDQFDTVVTLHLNEYDRTKEGITIEVNGVKRYLYAFTNDKQTAKDFEYMHNMDLFTKFTRHMNKYEYACLRSSMEHGELFYDFSHDLLLTKMEFYILDSSFEDIEVYLSTYSALGYEFFREEYIHALDILLYTLYYQLNGPDSNHYDYNYSYGLTPEGAPNDQVQMELNFAEMYLHIFSLILK